MGKSLSWRKIGKEARNILVCGGVGVLPTDTLYGVVGRALDKKAVERIYTLRKRNKEKPMIVLIGSLADLETFGVRADRKIKNLLYRVWPGKVSVILRLSAKRRALARCTLLFSFCPLLFALCSLPYVFKTNWK